MDKNIEEQKETNNRNSKGQIYACWQYATDVSDDLKKNLINVERAFERRMLAIKPIKSEKDLVVGEYYNLRTQICYLHGTYQKAGRTRIILTLNNGKKSEMLASSFITGMKQRLYYDCLFFDLKLTGGMLVDNSDGQCGDDVIDMTRRDTRFIEFEEAKAREIQIFS